MWPTVIYSEHRKCDQHSIIAQSFFQSAALSKAISTEIQQSKVQDKKFDLLSVYRFRRTSSVCCEACSVAATTCPRPLQVVTWTATQSFHFGGHCACRCASESTELWRYINLSIIIITCSSEWWHLLFQTWDASRHSRDVVLEASASARGSFFSWLGLASASHGLASVSTLLSRLCLIVSASVLARSGR